VSPGARGIMKELEVIDRLRKAFPGCGIGDDAAVLPGVEGDLLFAADAAIEGVHFDLRFSTLSQAIQKLVTSNVSDIFAMGGAPGAIVFTAGLKEGCSRRDVDGIIDGLTRSCAQYNVKLAGGDTVASPGRFVFNVAITGEVRAGRAVLRSGARAGDLIVLFGEIGRSRAGLGILSALFDETRNQNLPVPRTPGFLESASAVKKMLGSFSLATSKPELDRIAHTLGELPFAHELVRCAHQHLVPLAHPLAAYFLDAYPPCISAMIDVSDGIAKDLRTLCEEGAVGAVVNEEALPVPPALADIFGIDLRVLIDLALSSGEEYVLLATVSPAAAERLPGGATVIGTIRPLADGVVLVGKHGKRRLLPKLGYEHSF
jgi:thiamine-monophosphate kinase